MKKTLALALALVLCLSLFAACGSTPAPAAGSGSTAPASSAPAEKKPVTLNVVTSYGGDDGNRKNYEDAYKAYETATGNTVLDASETSNEEWKAKIMTDFETGSEPDVLFYFNGVDANKIIENGKVVSVEEIRKAFPDYASNMKDELMPVSPADGKLYAVPVNGYWEGLFVNKTVLADCGLEAPTATTTWDEFVKMCETIKAKGYTPIASSLQEVPHYWFEFTIANNGKPAEHTKIPAAGDDAVAQIWDKGFQDMKALYEAGFFPENTLTAGDADTFQLMADNKAAFAIDGSWKCGWFEENTDGVDNYTVTFVPAKGDRKATDMIGGISMGYYITKKAWDDPAKREAAVQFVQAMTTDEVVSKFGATSVTALKNGAIAAGDENALEKDAIAMAKNATMVIPATQDGLKQASRNALFADVKNIVTGKTTTADAITACLAVE